MPHNSICDSKHEEDVQRQSLRPAGRCVASIIRDGDGAVIQIRNLRLLLLIRHLEKKFYRDWRLPKQT